MGMLIEEREKNESTFYVECANWKSIVNAKDPIEAATVAFENCLEKYRENTEISPIATTLNISSIMKSMSIEENIDYIYAPTFLANAGRHKTSQDFQFIIENLKRNTDEDSNR